MMSEFEYLQHISAIESRLADSFMNYVTIYLAVLAALYFAARRLPVSLIASLVLLFTLYEGINLIEQRGLIQSLIQAEASLIEQFGETLPTTLQKSTPGIFGIPYPAIAYPLIYILTWVSVVGYSIYQYRRSELIGSAPDADSPDLE